MNILALETSTALGSVAVVTNGRVEATASSRLLKSHSEVISPFIDQCLRKSHLCLEDIDLFAVGIGPGSFTGIRVAVNAAKTFSYCFSKPLIGIDSLTLLARGAKKVGLPVLAIINAYKNMVYLGLFDVSEGDPLFLKGPMAIPVRELANVITEKCLVVGDGWDAYQDFFPDSTKVYMVRDSDSSDDPQATTLGELASLRAKSFQTIDWKSLLPLYIRASEAEENKKGILIQPLK